MALPATFWKRDFALLWSGSAVSHLGTVSATTAFPLVALATSGSPLLAGFATAAGTLPPLLLHLPAGLLADRMSHRVIMSVSQGLRLVMAALLATAFATGHRLPWFLLVGAAWDGIFATLYRTAATTAVRRMVPVEELRPSIARNEAGGHMALLLGRPLGGLLSGICGYSGAFVANAFSSFVCFLSLALISPRALQASRPDRFSERRRVREGLRSLWGDGFLRQALVVCTITNLLFQAMNLLLVVIARRHGLDSAQIGLLLGCSGLGGMVGSLMAPRVLRRVEPTRLVGLCLWTWAAVTTVITLTDRPVLGLLLWAGISFMGAQMNVALAVYQSEQLPEGLLGTGIGINNVLTQGAIPLGATVGGYALDLLDAQIVAIGISVCLTALASAWLALFGRRLRSAVGRVLRVLSSLAHRRKQSGAPDAERAYVGADIEPEDVHAGAAYAGPWPSRPARHALVADLDLGDEARDEAADDRNVSRSHQVR